MSNSIVQIRRYANRKLYDTQARQYIALEGIAILLRQGLSVQVVDHVSGEDITSQTLAQIIVEQERQQSGRFPQALLVNLIQAGEDVLSNAQHALQNWQPNTLATSIQHEIENRLRYWREHLPANVSSEQFEALSRVISAPPPTAAEYELLLAQVADLEAEVADLEAQVAQLKSQLP